MTRDELVARVLADSDLNESEAIAVAAVFTALVHTIGAAERLPYSLDARARDLILTKTQEALHWCLELTRCA